MYFNNTKAGGKAESCAITFGPAGVKWLKLESLLFG
jgi:hypothetical protein